MTIYSTQFSEYTDDVQPSDWTYRWAGDSANFKKRSGATTYGNAYLEYAAPSSASDAISWDDVVSAANVDVYASYRTYNLSSGIWIVARGSGSLGSETGYLMSVNSIGQVTFNYYNAGSFVALGGASSGITPVNGVWYSLRFQIIGTALKGKLWVTGDAEPAGWTHTVTNAVISAAGWSGLRFHGNVIDVDYVSYATGGDVPTWPVPTSDFEATLPALRSYTPGFFSGDMSGRISPLFIEASENPALRSRLEGTLPAIEVEITGSTHGDLIGVFPTLQVESFGGGIMTAYLPEMAVESVGVCAVRGFFEATLPPLGIETSAGARCGVLKIPTLSIEAISSTPIIGRLEKYIPGLKIEASGYSGSGWLSKDIGFLRLEATGSQNGSGDLEAYIPGLKIAARSFAGSVGYIEGTLPDIRISAHGYSSYGAVYATLPAIVTSIASGGDTGNSSNTIIESGRFDGTLLRFSRWA